MIRQTFWMVLLLLCIQTGRGAAHELLHTVVQDDSVVVDLTYPGGEAFSYETYEILGPGDSAPFQTGRTDGNGRIVFVPDRAGRWRVRAFAADGHGAEFTVEMVIASSHEPAEPAPMKSAGRIAIGVAVILAVFGVLSLFLRKKKS